MRILQAVEMIDGEIKQPFSQLRRKKELPGSGYYDTFRYTQGLARVPDALRPKSAGLLCTSQQRVYEVKQLNVNKFLCFLSWLTVYNMVNCSFQDFITVWHSQSSQNAGATTAATAEVVAPGNSSIPRVYSPNLVLPADLVLEESDRGTRQLLR